MVWPPKKEIMEAMLMILPRPLGSMTRPASWQSTNTELRLTLMTSSQSEKGKFLRLMTPLDTVGVDQNVQIAAQQLQAGVEACQGLLPAAQIRLDAMAGKAAAAEFLCDAVDALGAADDDHFAAFFQRPSAMPCPSPRVPPVTMAFFPLISNRFILFTPSFPYLSQACSAA